VDQVLSSGDMPASSQVAQEAGLSYIDDDTAGIIRRRSGKGFTYRSPSGARIADRPQLARIRSLAIPPAWTDVWICPDSLGHIQATGRDIRGRKQYCYHAEFRKSRESAKYQHLFSFAGALPGIRAQVAADMALPGLPRERVIATVVNLLEITLIRVGNSGYARDNKSYGLTTLNSPHVKVEGTELRFHFKGKSGRIWRLALKNRRVAKVVRACQELPGQQLFQYLDAAGESHNVTSNDVNDYLRAVSGLDVSAKDFRTWAGTLDAAWALQRAGAAANQIEAKRTLKAVLEAVAARLGNTVTICRKCYVHPEIIERYLGGRLDLALGSNADEHTNALKPEEAGLLALLAPRERMAA
jgi:DNA topoisomerase-1